MITYFIILDICQSSHKGRLLLCIYKMNCIYLKNFVLSCHRSFISYICKTSKNISYTNRNMWSYEKFKRNLNMKEKFYESISEECTQEEMWDEYINGIHVRGHLKKFHEFKMDFGFVSKM